MEDRRSHDEHGSLAAARTERPLWQTWHVTGAGRQILFAALVAGLAFGTRLALDPWLGNRQPFTPAIAAIAIVAWFAGWRAGLLAAVICHLAATYFFIAPRHTFMWSAEEAVGAGSYYLIAGLIVFLVHSATRANRSLAGMVSMLRKVDERKTQFLALLGHELRNPLGTLRTGMDLLKSGALDPAETRRTHQMMERQLGQMQHLVEDLLDIARIDQGKIVLHARSVSVGTAVADAVTAARTYTEPMRQNVAIDVPAGIGTIEADPARVSQVLTNLLHNASKFSPRGSHIEVSARSAGQGVAITVRDSGIGIPGGQLDSIFGSFVQLQPAGNQPGLGLGLSLVRRLMEMHGGSVEARSDGPGNGSEFTVVFPRGKSPAAAIPAPAPTPAPAREAASATGASRSVALRLMVVDDNQDAADSLAMLLELKGHQVITANDGQSALLCAQQQPLDFIFLDLGMPDMDGFEVAQRLRDRNPQRRPMLVALTGWGGEEDRRRTRSAGFDHHLTKPVGLDALDKVLQGARATATAPDPDASYPAGSRH